MFTYDTDTDQMGFKEELNPEEGAIEVESKEAEEKPKHKVRKKNAAVEPELSAEDEDASWPYGNYRDSKAAENNNTEAYSSQEDSQAGDVIRGSDTFLDEYGRIVTDRKISAQDSINRLIYANRRRIILTGTVDGIERDGNVLPRVALFSDGIKVLIPFSEMGFDLNRGEIDERNAGRIINTMLGAKIDYMVRKVDSYNRIAAASRRDAMILRQKTILNARAGSGYRIREGMKCTARVIRVDRHVMLVEVYGFQTYIGKGNISRTWVNDIRDIAKEGEEKLVTVMALVRDERTGEVIRMDVSMREAEEIVNANLRPGNTYTAVITGMSQTAYFARILGVDAEVRCPVKINQILESLDIGDTVKVLIRRPNENGAYSASIRKLIKKADRPFF